MSAFSLSARVAVAPARVSGVVQQRRGTCLRACVSCVLRGDASIGVGYTTTHGEKTKTHILGFPGMRCASVAGCSAFGISLRLLLLESGTHRGERVDVVGRVGSPR